MEKSIKLLILLCFIASSTMAQLNSDEKKIVEFINAHLKDSEQLLIESVNVNSGTLNVEGVKKVGAIYRKELDKIGFTTEWVVLPDSLRRAGHLVATVKGNQGKKLFLIGHLDTVFELDMAFAPYTKLNDSTATGQGVNDMKGGNVVMIGALRALSELGLLKNTQIVAYFTGDEESSGSPHHVARQDFIERAKTTDIALGFEGAQGLHTVAVARRGIGGWVLNVEAKTGHSAGVFSEGAGYGAIYEAARIINEFRTQLANEKYLTFNPGLISGGSEIKVDRAAAKLEAVGKTNIISPAAYAAGDLRYISEAQRESAREKMRSIVAQSLNGTKSRISFSDGLPAMEPTEGNYRLVKFLDDVTRDMGLGETVAGDPGSRGAGDISDIAKYVDSLDGMGASGSGSHKPGETINLKEFPYLIQRAAIMIYRLTRQGATVN
ncbi:M20/M25/M40 family metallo-hydrolase [Daejeonella lutea]|uniref:Glutamate carboxypeptidase n=1 Tax=Daejeonella lutea TaxID=572036 RepID=A0A1T5DWB0_9SPHI|nr:M20/M25/M40 family metallo-hydrolase [Daejeonella lutea]SKB75713.1 glutamate carboxypeptidase [Daejeonella lutea]